MEMRDRGVDAWNSSLKLAKVLRDIHQMVKSAIFE
jgi:hypothetical protein